MVPFICVKVAMLPRSGMCCEGGTARYLQEILPGLLLKGHDFTVYSTGLNAQRQELYPQIKHIIIPGGHLSLSERLTTAEKHVMHACSQDFDILHVHYPSTTFFMEKIHASGKKIVVTHHGSQFIRPLTDDVLGRQLYSQYKLKLREADAVIVHSPILFEAYRAEGVKNVRFIPMGVTFPEKNIPLPTEYSLEQGKYILFVGKFRREKGLDILIEAYKRINSDIPLVIIGNDEFEPEYAKECKISASKNKNIIFLGERLCRERDVLISNASFYVNPLRIQGLPLSVLEAAVAGKGIINSDNSNHHGIIAECTHKFQSENVESLAESMQFFMNNPNYVLELGRKAEEYARINHSIEEVVKLCNYIYNNI